MPKPSQTRKRVGRPSKYSPDMNGRAIALAKKGKHLTQIACSFGVVKDTLLEWARVHPEFSVTLALCKQYNEAFWLDLSQKKAKTGQGDSTIIKFMLSAAHNYREKSDTTSETNLHIDSEINLDFGERE